MLGKNRIRIRIENLGDLFDTKYLAEEEIDVAKLAEKLFKYINANAEHTKLKITEKTLVGTEKHEDMLKKRFYWLTKAKGTNRKMVDPERKHHSYRVKLH